MCVSISAIANAQGKVSAESTELWNPVPRVVTPGGASTANPTATAPSDALVLFDGKIFQNGSRQEKIQKRCGQ